MEGNNGKFPLEKSKSLFGVFTYVYNPELNVVIKVFFFFKDLTSRGIILGKMKLNRILCFRTSPESLMLMCVGNPQ